MTHLRMTRQLACAGAWRLLAAAIAATPLVAQQKVDVRHAVTPDFFFRVTGSIGTLRVTGWDRDSLAVTGVLPVGVRMEVGIGGDGLTPARGAKMYIEAPNDAATSTGSLEIRVPRRARVWIKSGTSNVDVRGVSGGLDVNVIGGSVHVAASPRELQVEAMDAAVVIEGTPAWLRAKTASGDITVRGGSADLSLTSVSGSIRVEGGAVERGRMETVTGGIWFAATPSGAGEMAFDTHSGGMDLRLIGRDNFTLLASSITGAVDNQYDNTRVTVGREGRGAELMLERGRESARLTARSFKGTITVRR